MSSPAKPILPMPIINVGCAAPQPFVHYLDGVREDNLLDGLITTSTGQTGGGWKNAYTGLGTFGRDKVMQGRFEEPARIMDPELSALYNGSDLAQRIVTARPREMFRRGWCLVVPQEEDGDDAKPDDGGAAAAEQRPGGESGPAAPGAPLVDPMGAAPDNATAKGVGAAASVAPPAEGAEYDDPMGSKLQKTATQHPTPSPTEPTKPEGATDPKTTTPITAKDNKKTPGKEKPDQNKGANLALNAEAYAARLGAKDRLLEGTIFGRLYGGGLLIIGADDGQDMSLPLDETKISTIRYLSWIDRRFIFASQWYTEIGPKYGEVEVWEIVNPFGGQSNTRVHETRCLRFDGTAVDFLMRRRLLGWTLSVLQAPYDTLRQFDMSFQSVANLMADLSQAVMKINGLAQLISNDQKTLNTRMQMVDISRSSARMLYLDAENEEFQRTATPMTGVADALEMLMLRMAAAAEMPVAILFGREPSGLNATGDADFRRFYNVIAGEQVNVLEPKLRRLYTLIFAAKDGPTGGKVPQRGIEFTWHKLYEPSEKEQAEIRWLMAQADDKYIGNGALLPEEVAMSRFRSGDLHLDTEIETELREESLASAELAPSGAAKAEQEAEQAKDLAVTTANAKGGAGGPPGKGKPAAKPAPRGDALELEPEAVVLLNALAKLLTAA